MNFEPNNICKRIVLFVYTLAIFCVYPIIVDDAYFNITITKTNFFQKASIIFIVCFVIAILADVVVHSCLDIKEKFLYNDKTRFFSKPLFWMELFILANVLAWYMTDCSQAAITGENARYMGMKMYVIIGMVFICIIHMVDVSKLSVIAFAFVTAYTYIIGMIQHLEIDIHYWNTGQTSPFEFMHYRQLLSGNQFDIYMSTFGNINIFSSFIVISLSLFLGVFTFTNVNYIKLIAGTVVVLGGASLMIANSDSGYIGVAGAMFVLLLISYNAGRVKNYVMSLVMLACGNLLVVLMNIFAVEKYDKRGGFAQALDRIDVAFAVVFLLAVMYVIVHLISKKYKEKLEKLNKKIITIAIIATTVISGIMMVVIGNLKGVAAFTFNDKWGTYRGFVWSRAWNIFTDAPLINKIFGYGNETFASYMNAYYYNDMKEIVGKYYDNAHNELLQYLVTLGVFGLLTYLGVVITSIIYMIKYGKGNYIVYGFLTATIGYFVQSWVNLNQPITTPLYFVIMAIGVGYTTYLRKKDGDYD